MASASLPFESVFAGDQITLTQTDRSRLYTCVHTGCTSARVRTRAQVLLKLGEGWSLSEVCRAFDVCRTTAVRVRTRFAEGVGRGRAQRAAADPLSRGAHRLPASSPHRRRLQHRPGWV
jgi:hypothetical protein